MDYLNIIGHWEGEGHGIDRINGSCMLWTIIPMPGKVC